MNTHTQGNRHIKEAPEKGSLPLNPKLLAFIKRPEHYAIIQKFWQGVENKDAKRKGRIPKTVALKTANRRFQRALQSKGKKSPYTEHAEVLLQKLLKTPAALNFFKKKVIQPKDMPNDDPHIKTHKTIDHYTEQAQKLRTQMQSNPPGSEQLLLKQKKLYSKLANTFTVLVNRIDVQEATNPVELARKDYDRLLRQADKLGLGNDPYIQEWLSTHPTNAKRIMSQPISMEELMIHDAIDEMRQKGNSLKHIRKVLEHKNLISKKSNEAFRKWFHRRKLGDLYPKKVVL